MLIQTNGPKNGQRDHWAVDVSLQDRASDITFNDLGKTAARNLARRIEAARDRQAAGAGPQGGRFTIDLPDGRLATVPLGMILHVVVRPMHRWDYAEHPEDDEQNVESFGELGHKELEQADG